MFWLGDFNFRCGTSEPIIEDTSCLYLANGKTEDFKHYLSQDQVSVKKSDVGFFNRF